MSEKKTASPTDATAKKKSSPNGDGAELDAQSQTSEEQNRPAAGDHDSGVHPEVHQSPVKLSQTGQRSLAMQKDPTKKAAPGDKKNAPAGARKPGAKGKGLKVDAAMPLAVLKALPDIIFAFEVDTGRLRLWNPACSRRLGFRPESMSFLRAPEKVVMEKDHDRFRAAVRRALEDGEAHLELRLLQASGSHIPCECVLSSWSMGQQQGIVLQARDISQREKERRQLLAYARELKEVTRRSQLANAQKSTFMAALSHEIRTPLNVILGMAEVLQRTSLDDRQVNYLSLLETSGRSLLELLSDILDYARAESGQIQIQQTPLDIRLLLQQTCDLLQPKAQGKGLELSSAVDGDVPWLLLTDETRLGQVLRNLVDNAIKYTDQGFVQLNASLAGPVTQGKPVPLRITIQDSGKGIEPEMQEKIFQPFYQVRQQKGPQKGAGLGLAICKQIVVELFKGKLRLKSAPGKGSAFILELDLPMPQEGQKVFMDVDECAPDISSEKELPPLQILCVEDAEENRIMLETMFEGTRHTLTFAEDGEEGVLRFKEYQERGGYDIVLMDVHLPGMDGLEAAREIRRMEKQGTHVPIIALTAYALRDDREKCLQAGCDEYVSKPFSSAKLFKAMGKVLEDAVPRPEEKGRHDTASQKPDAFVFEESPNDDADSDAAATFNEQHIAPAAVEGSGKPAWDDDDSDAYEDGDLEEIAAVPSELTFDDWGNSPVYNLQSQDDEFQDIEELAPLDDDYAGPLSMDAFEMPPAPAGGKEMQAAFGGSANPERQSQQQLNKGDQTADTPDEIETHGNDPDASQGVIEIEDIEDLEAEDATAEELTAMADDWPQAQPVREAAPPEKQLQGESGEAHEELAATDFQEPELELEQEELVNDLEEAEKAEEGALLVVSADEEDDSLTTEAVADTPQQPQGETVALDDDFLDALPQLEIDKGVEEAMPGAQEHAPAEASASHEENSSEFLRIADEAVPASSPTSSAVLQDEQPLAQAQAAEDESSGKGKEPASDDTMDANTPCAASQNSLLSEFPPEEWTPEILMREQNFTVTPCKQMQSRATWYRGRLQHHLESLEQALEDNETETIATIGHKLKGSAAGFGFDLAAHIGAALEGEAKAGNMENVAAWLSALQHYLRHARISLET